MASGILPSQLGALGNVRFDIEIQDGDEVLFEDDLFE